MNKRQKALIVVGLGYGDEGKGLTVNELCKEAKNPIVIRFSGGQQAGHTVVHGGIKHTCSNFGAGVLQGVPTYFSEHTTFYPVTIARETLVLKKKGIKNPKLILHPMARITTPWDVFMNRLCDNDLNHGTCGLGVGKTMKRNEGTYQLRAIDLIHRESFNAKLSQISQEYGPFINGKDFDKEIVEFNKACDSIDWTIGNYDVLGDYQTLIFEGSQGIMLDMDHGVFPNVTYANTTSKNAMEICDKVEIDDRTVYGVSRAYSTRHGLGNGRYTGEPIELSDMEGETNITNKYQGEFLTSAINYSRLNYAWHLESIYSHRHKHCMVVTCCNQVPVDKKFKISKINFTTTEFFFSYTPQGEFKRVY